MSENASTNPDRGRANVASYLRRVSSFERQGMYDEAIESLKKVIEIAPGEARHCIRLANLYRAQRKFEPAIAAMRRAIELDPRNAGVHESLLQIYVEIGRYDDAIRTSKQLIRRHPRNLYARDILGVAYLQKGQIEEALNVTNELINLDPMDAANHFKKAILFQQKGEFARAIEEFTRTLEMDPEGEMSRDAQEAITVLDGYQMRMILMLAAGDPIFRAKLSHDLELAVAERGFNLSYTGYLALSQLDLAEVSDWSLETQQRYYH